MRFLMKTIEKFYDCYLFVMNQDMNFYGVIFLLWIMIKNWSYKVT